MGVYMVERDLKGIRMEDLGGAQQAAIRKAGVIGTVGFNQRHDHRHEAIHDFVQNKRLVMATAVANGSLESHSIKHTHTEELGGPGNRVWAASAAWSATPSAGVSHTSLAVIISP